MANILDRYGIKEVADVMFYKILSTGAIGAPVLYLDTLKVSTVEQTAQNTSAKGGKGNAELIMWDYGKEITVTLEDALFSAKSMAMMYGDINGVGTSSTVVKTIQFTATATTLPTQLIWTKPDGTTATVASSSGTFYDATNSSTVTAATIGDVYYFTYNQAVTGYEITISADTFPGTYYVTGDTYARSETTGEDEFFQFIIPKAKVMSEVTLTLEAEGDPTTFSMNLKVLRPKDKVMMKLVKYTVA
jgi:hypothetical protein